jgi:hypothetical protein
MMKVYSRRQLMLEMGRPYDAEIEYLESSGGSRMSIPFVWDKLYTVEISYYITDSIDQVNIFRTNGQLGNNVVIKAYKSINSLTHDYGIGNMPFSPYKTGRHTSVVTATYSQYDGIKKNWHVSNVKDNTKILLFHNANDTEAKTRIYYAIVKDPNSLENVIDFIPVRIGNVGYMFDKVSGKLFGNAGTGNFILGPDK